MIIWKTEYCYNKEKGITLMNDNHFLAGWHPPKAKGLTAKYGEVTHFRTVRGLLKYLRTQYPHRLWRSKLTHYYGTIVEIQAGRKLED